MPAFTRENSSLSQRFQGALYTPFVYGGTKPRPSAQFDPGATGRHCPRSHSARQADSLTRLRDSRAVFRRVLRTSSNSPTAFWKHGEALRHVRHKRNPLGEHNRSELDPLSTIRNVFRMFQSWRKIGTSESRDGSLLRSETETARSNPRIPLTPRIRKRFQTHQTYTSVANRAATDFEETCCE
jgi:hypothetical protein